MQRQYFIPIDFDKVSENYEWYTVVTRFNYEQKFINDFISAIKAMNCRELVEDIFFPAKEYILEYTNSKGKTAKKNVVDKVISLYVFVKAKMTKELYEIIKKTSGCSTILSLSDMFSTMTNDEINNIRNKCVVTEKEIKGMKVISHKDPYINYFGK